MSLSEMRAKRGCQSESEEAIEKSKAAEAEDIAGIYVYTLPHYVRYPYDRKSGRTLLKVGHSSVEALYRARSQTRVTSLPEDPVAIANLSCGRVVTCREAVSGILA